MKQEQQPYAPIPKEQSIVIVDDTPDNLRLLVGILNERGYKVRPAPNGVRALATVEKELPELILLDIMMPEMNGYEVCRRLKENEKTHDIPVIFLSALNEVFDKVKAFQAGGVDFITKPFQVEEVLARVNTHLTIRAQQKALKKQNKELHKKNILITEQTKKLQLLAITDSLTGLSNRRDFLKKTIQEAKRFERSKNPFSFLFLDIDHFKTINDTYGHNCGDAVLIGVARSLEKSLRGQDILARWGGEEFVCLLPDTNTEGARNVAEKMRCTIENLSQKCGDIPISVTVTLGICLYDGSRSTEECINYADACMYRGKQKGRNQVVISAK